MHFAQRLANRAAIALIAFGVLGEALRQNDGAVDGADHFERRNIPRIARQPIAAIRALLGNQQAAARQFLQDFRKQGQRNAVIVGDILGACAPRGLPARCRRAISP
jgi:hypothetical protein